MNGWKKLSVGLILTVFVIGGYAYFSDVEGRVFTFVKKNHEEMEVLCEEYIKQKNREAIQVMLDSTKVVKPSYDIYEDYKGVEIEKIYKGEHDIVQFFYTGRGLVTNSIYYGFYYSPDDVAVAYSNIEIDLKQIDDTTWEWNEENSDNGGRIIKIMDKWYYYKTWF